MEVETLLLIFTYRIVILLNWPRAIISSLFGGQFFVLCLCNKTVKDLGSKKRDRDRGTVTLGPAALYVTIIWGRVWMRVTTT